MHAPKEMDGDMQFMGMGDSLMSKFPGGGSGETKQGRVKI
jgi:hypothetical protein